MRYFHPYKLMVHYFPRWLYHFTFPAATDEYFSCSAKILGVCSVRWFFFYQKTLNFSFSYLSNFLSFYIYFNHHLHKQPNCRNTAFLSASLTLFSKLIFLHLCKIGDMLIYIGCNNFHDSIFSIKKFIIQIT